MELGISAIIDGQKIVVSTAYVFGFYIIGGLITAGNSAHRGLWVKMPVVVDCHSDIESQNGRTGDCQSDFGCDRQLSFGTFISRGRSFFCHKIHLLIEYI